MSNAMPVALKMTLIAVALAGGSYDLRFRKIPNWLNLSGIVLGLGLNVLLSQGPGFTLSALGLGLAFLIYFPLYLIRAMGAGDVKMMAAIGSIVGPNNWLAIFLVTSILGGAASVVLVVRQGRFYATLANLVTITRELLHARLPFHKDARLDVRDKRAIGLPHGAVIAAGSLAFLAWGLYA